MKSNATLMQIAEKAGVSIATVSRILNDTAPVAPATRQKVWQAIRDLEYDSVMKRSAQACQSLLVLVPDVINPFYANVIDGIQQAAHNHAFEAFLLPTKDQYPNGSYLVNMIKKERFSGVLWLSSTPPVEVLSVIEHHCPMVMCCEYPEEYPCSYVSIDDRTAAFKAVQYLISTGCRRIGFINCSPKYKYARHRREGYLQALKAAGLEQRPEWYVTLPAIDYTLAYSAIMQSLSAQELPDAFFACSDVYAAAAVNAASSLGLRVPEELSVIGIDNIETSRMTQPPITTVAQPGFQMGQQACALLIEKIHNLQPIDQHILLSTELIIRGSTR